MSESFSFQAEVSQVLNLVVNSLYSNKEIFLRELVSNSSDALDKLRFRSIEDKGLTQVSSPSIRLVPDESAAVLRIEDDGIGMTKEELVKNLGTIAHSGTQEFLSRLEEAKGDVSLIGQFGVGFYSAFLVADTVEVISRGAGADAAWKWTSDGKSEFSIESAERAAHGTTLVLHLKEDETRYASSWVLRDLVRRYSDFVSYPIQMTKTPMPSDEESESETAEAEWETVNEANALWQRSKSEVTDEQYTEFYKHLTGDMDEPLTHTHFTVEGMQLFTGLLYIPKTAPFDLYTREHRRGVRLYVKRVFIMDDAEDLVPVWLRFVKGLIDSDDLPLNVSRELLQDSRITRTIRKQLIKRVLDALAGLAKDDTEKYLEFWTSFGPVLKEGLHFDYENKAKLSELMRYRSSKSESWTSLAEYVERMPEGQSSIYYITGDNEQAVKRSPHLETLKKKGYEVLYMTDAIDEWAVGGLGEYEERKLVSVMDADLLLEESEEEKKERAEVAESLSGLSKAIQTVLEETVSEVQISTRLTDSPVCLVVPDGGINARMERLLRATERDVPAQKRVLEVNPEHVLIQRLKGMHDAEPGTDQFVELVELLHDQALLVEGSPIPDPQKFARQVTQLLERVTLL